MKSTFIFILFFIFLSISVSGQAPIPLSAMARSADPLMTIQTNSSRYQNYQYFTTAWGDTLLNFMQANPNWLGTYLPAGAVNIAAAGNNLQFTQGGTLRWTSDTTSLGEWIPQFTVSPALSGGLINQRLIGVGSLANKYIGISGQDNFGLYVDGYPDLYLRNDQVLDTSLAAGNYYSYIDQTGKVTFGQSGIFDAINSNSVTIPQQMYAKTLDPDLDPQLYFGYFPSFPNLNLDTEQTNGVYISPFYWGSNGIVNSDGAGNQSDISGFTTGFYARGKNRSSGFFTSTNVGGILYSNAVTNISNQDTVTSNPVYNSIKQYTYDNSGAGTYVIGSITKIQDFNESRDYYMGFGKSKGSTYLRENVDNYTFEGANYGFVIQSRSTTADTFNFLRVDLESTSANAVKLYDKYSFSNSTPTSTNGVKSLHTWTGNGTNTTPAMEEMEDLFAIYNAQASSDLELVSTADSTTAYPLFSNVTKTNTDFYENQGDTVIFFKQPGVYRIDAGLIFETSGSTQSVNTILKFEPSVSYGRSFSIDANADRTSHAYNAVVTISTAYTKLRISKQVGAIATSTFFGSDSRVTIQRVY